MRGAENIQAKMGNLSSTLHHSWWRHVRLIRSVLFLFAIAGTAAVPRPAAAFDPLYYNTGSIVSTGNGSVLSPELVPLFWGDWTAAEQANTIAYLQSFALYLSGFSAPNGMEPVTKQYGVLGAHVVPGFSIGMGSDTLIKDTGIYQRIHLLQSQGNLPPDSPSRVFVVFLRGIGQFRYNFDDAGALVNANTCAYHNSNYSTYYAVLPWEVMNANPTSNCAGAAGFQATISHEIMEAATDPIVGNSWLTQQDWLHTGEGADQCGKNTLAFGTVSTFTDNVLGCTSFTNATYTHIGALASSIADNWSILAFWPTLSAANLDLARWNGSSWSYQQLFDPNALVPAVVWFIGQPTAVQMTTSRTDVFVMGSDNAIHHVFRDLSGTGQWTWLSPITSPPGLPGFIGEPSAVSWGSGRIDMVVLGTDLSVMHLFSNDGFTFFTESMGGQTRGAPRIVSRGTNLLDFYTEGTTGEIVENSWSPGWSGYHTTNGVGGGRLIRPTITNWDVNRKDLFWGGQHQWAAVGYGWGWEYFDGAYGEYQATPRSSIGIDVTWRGTDGGAHYRGYNRSTGWTSSMNLHGIYNGPPTIVESSPVGGLYILGAGTDGCLYYNHATRTDHTTWEGPFNTGVPCTLN